MYPQRKIIVLTLLAFLFLALFSTLPFNFLPIIREGEATTNTLFQDGFESGGFSLWTGTANGSGDSCTVTEASAKNGFFGANFTVDSSGYAYAYKDFSAVSDHVYSSYWIKITGQLPDNTQDYIFQKFGYGGTTTLTAKITKDSGSPKWELGFYNSTTYYSLLNATPTINLNQWYEVKTYEKIHATTGEVKLWVDNALVISDSGLNTTKTAQINRLQIGETSTAYTAHSTLIDDVQVYYITESGASSGTIGYTSIGSSDNQLYAGFIYWYGAYPIDAETTVNFTEMHLYTTSTGNARVAIYSSVNNEPSALIVESGSQACSADSWNTFNIADTEFWSESDAYFVAVQFSTHYMARTTYAYWKTRYKGWSYGSFPSTVSNLGIIHHETSLYANYTLSDNPFYGNVATNTTKASRPCMFSVEWRDNGTLSHSIFSWNNGSTTWTNTSTSLSGSTAWHNVTKKLNATASTVISYKWYGNDTSNNWQTTQTYTLTTTALITVPYFTSNHANASRPNYPCNFSIQLDADYTLEYAMLEHNNTGTVTNTTAIALSGISTLANTTLTLNNTVCMVQYRWIANTTEGYNVTGYYNLTVAEPVNGALNVTGNELRLIATNEQVILRGVNYVGYTDAPSGYWANNQSWFEPQVEKEIRAMAMWGLNHIRMHITVKWWLQGNVTNAYGTHNYRYNIKRAIQIANNYGIYVVVDGYMVLGAYEEGARYTPCPFPPYLNAYEEVWITSELDFIEFCKSVVSELKNEPNFMFEVWNEPSSGQSDFFRVSKQAIEELRQISTTPVIIQWGYCWGVDWAWDSGLGLPFSTIPNMVYSGHVYRYHGTFSNNEYTYADVKSELINRYWYEGMITRNLAMYCGETGAHIVGERDIEEESAFNNTMQILYKEWNISFATFWWRNLQPWRHIGNYTYLYPEMNGKLLMAGANIQPFVFSVGNETQGGSQYIYSNNSVWSSSYASMELTITYTSKATVRCFWNTSSAFPINASLKILAGNGTLYNATDFFVSATNLIEIWGIGGSFKIGYGLTANTAPQYGSISIDQCIAGEITVFRCALTDDTALGFGFLSHNSSSGIWMNETALALSGLSDTLIVSLRLTSLINEVVGYKFYANDSAGTWNATNIYTLTTIPQQSGGGSEWIQNVESQKLIGLSVVAGIAVLALITVTVILPKKSLSRRRGF